MVEQKGINGIQRRHMHSCGKIMYTKDSVWKYEKEYRIVTRNHKDIENDMFDSYKNQKGSLHKTQEFNLSLASFLIDTVTPRGVSDSKVIISIEQYRKCGEAWYFNEFEIQCFCVLTGSK